MCVRSTLLLIVSFFLLRLGCYEVLEAFSLNQSSLAAPRMTHAGALLVVLAP